MNTETKLKPEYEKTLSKVWDRGEFDIHYNALSSIVGKRPEVLDDRDIIVLNGILSYMDIFRAAKTAAGEAA